MMQNSRLKKLVRLAIVLLAIGAVLFLAWELVFKRPSVEIVLPEGSTKARLANTSDNTVIEVTQTERRRLDRATYLITYLKDDQAVGVSKAVVKGLSPRQTIEGSIAKPNNKLSAVLHQHADMLTPFENGYLYLNTQTRGIEYMSAAGGIQELNERFEMAVVAPDPDIARYNTVVNIEAMKNGDAVVTTTSGVFLVKNLNDITKLQLSTEESLNFTSSSYDNTSNRLYLLSSFGKKIYSYDLGFPTERIKVFGEAGKQVNRVVANGGKVIVFYDAVPSAEKHVLDEYDANRQISPLLFSIDGAKLLKTFDDFKGTTQASISGDGRYITLKKKFATTMSLIKVDDGTVYEVPAADAGGITWQGDTLYIARDKSIWSIKPNQDPQAFSYIAATNDTITRLSTEGDTLMTTYTNSVTSKIVDNSFAETAADALSKATLQGDGYYTTFISNGPATAVIVEVKGMGGPGTDNPDDPTFGQAQQYQMAINELKAAATAPGVSISQRDTSLINRYLYAGIPLDYEESDF